MPARKSMADKATTMGALASSKQQVAGSKAKILILHGWSYSTEKWEPFLNLIKGKDLNPRLLDIPGLTEPTDRVWTLEDYVEWLKEKVGTEKTILIGHSNGGRISIAFALKYPELVERLILIDSAGIRHRGGLTELKKFIFGSLAKIGKRITASEGARNALHKLARANDYKNASPEMRETMVNLISTDLSPELNNMKVPTLIIWGAEDKTTPLSDGKLMHKLILHSKLYIVNEARHSPQFTHPKEVCAKIVKWIR